MAVLDFVNAKIGTLNDRRFSNGNVYPVTACPFGMTNFTVQTDGGAGNWFYSPLSHAFEGIRLTHQPSPWVGDYGHLLFLPFSGELRKEPHARWSGFRPEKAALRPERLEAYLQRYGVRVKLAPTERGGIFTVENENFGRGATGFALLPYAESEFRVKDNVASGWTDSQSIWGFARVREYFYVEFSKPASKTQPTENGGVAVWFDSPCVEIKVATSFISEEQAKRNFERELREKDYAAALEWATALWEDCLGRIRVSDENPERKRTFYSCLYRAFLYPRVFHEYDGDGKPVHFNADTGKAESGVFYTDNGFWDTYRTVYPLLSILFPERVREMAEGFVNYAEETGWLPKWLSPGEIGIMPGTLVEAVLADACVKGIVDGELRQRAYRAMLKNAYEKSPNVRQGRKGIEEYLRYGYVTDGVRECVNHTCDCAYGDFCIAQVAALVGDTAEAEKLYRRSKNYANLFDGESGFLRGKNANGEFKKDFDPYAWGGDNCEGSSWQNSFAVYHDVEGLAALYGGKDKLEARLDELFSAPPVFRVGGYGEEIHEMSEMSCVDFGQCAISNQPSFHIPWLYTALGKREKTEYWVEKLAKEAFSAEADGFPGDEDNGTTACWYIFACLGFYPLCPGKGEYVLSKPLFEKIWIGGAEPGRFDGDILSHSVLMQKLSENGGR